MSRWFYFSFADGELPKGEQFLGGCYVELPEDPDALARAELYVRERRGSPDEPVEEEAVLVAAALGETYRLGINPGGEGQVQGPISSEVMDEHVPAELRNRLLSRDEVESH